MKNERRRSKKVRKVRKVRKVKKRKIEISGENVDRRSDAGWKIKGEVWLSR